MQNAQFPEPPSGGKPEPPFQDAPKKLLLYKNPLRHRCAMPPFPTGEVWEANLSVCFADSSPNRGALGRPGKPCCSLGLNWAQGSGPCSHWQRLRNYALPKSAGQAVVNRDSGARSFPIAENFARSARPPPSRQWLPYQGSWHREAMTERLYPMPHFRSVSRLSAGDPSYNLSVTFGDTSPCRRGFGIPQTSPLRDD